MIIFSKNGDLHGEFSSLPNKSYLEESKWIIAELPEGESFDPSYAYSCVEGVAIKGNLIPENQEENARLKREFDATQYQRDRRQEYPNEHDLIVALWEKVMEEKSESADALQTIRAGVKSDNPKPN